MGDPYLGSVLGGRYRLVRKLGEGGMGSVYRAEVLEIKHTVAVKVLHERFVSDETALRRFERDKLVGAKWERVSTAREEGRPPRRYYKLTARGQGALTEARARYGALGRLMAPPKQA